MDCHEAEFRIRELEKKVARLEYAVYRLLRGHSDNNFESLTDSPDKACSIFNIMKDYEEEGWYD